MSGVHDSGALLETAFGTSESSFQYGDPQNFISKKVDEEKISSDEQEYDSDALKPDPYHPDEADKEFLSSKPTCFLVLGKPGVGKTTLARKLAEDWHTELISISDLISTNMKQKTELGVRAKDLLLRGEPVPDEMVSRMLEIKMKSPEVAHHGYTMDDFPLMDENFMKLRDQLDMMKNWPLKPDFVINFRIPDSDLEVRRLGQKTDPITGALYIKEQYAPTQIEKPIAKTDVEEEENDDEQEDEVMEEEQLEDEFFTPLSTEIVERLVTRPEDMAPDVKDSIDSFKNRLLRLLEEYMAGLDRSYLVELDGNLPPSVCLNQLLERLSVYPIRRAARVQRFFPQEDEEEEIADEGQELEGEEEGGDHAVRAPREEEIPGEQMDTEELMLSLSGSNTLSNKFKWHRSRWLRCCPVALKQGNRVDGRQDLAVHFMDKIYVLSTKEALKEFQKNPRRYINDPRPPCKLFLYGPKHSGIEQLASDIGKRYNATVIDMDAYAKPKIDELRKRYVEDVRMETETATIEKVQQQLNAEAEEKQANDDTNQTQQEEEIAEKSEEKLNEEGEQSQEKAEENAEEISPTTSGQDQSSLPLENNTDINRDDLGGIGPEDEQTQYERDGKVTADHPEVKKAVELAIEEARKAAINIPADVYADLIQKAIQAVEAKHREKNPTGPLFGNWIFVNFPYENDIWANLAEKNIQPDDIVVLLDSSDKLEALQKRWYSANKTDIDRQIRERLEREAVERRQKDEAQKQQMEEMKKIAEQERNERQMERQRKIDAGETVEEEQDDREEKEMQAAILEDKKYEPKKEDYTIPETIPEEDESMSKDVDKTSNPDLNRPPVPISSVSNEETTMPPAGVELNEFLQEVKADVDKINALVKLITNTMGIEPITIDLMKEDTSIKNHDEIVTETIDGLEKQFKYVVQETADQDDEEEEDGEENDEDGNEGEEEEDDNDLFKKDRKKHLGDTSIYCPVALLDKNILVPGKPDLTASYEGKAYRFSTDDARTAFMQNPIKYLPTDKPPKLPAIRMLFIGAEGVGKSLHARELAKKLNIFHIKFRDRLQELIIAKTKMKIGPEFAEGREDPDNEESEEKSEKTPDEVEELTPEQENIKAYLQDGEALAPEILDKLIKVWWNDEPFKSRGIILEGFPNNEDETGYMIENSLIPDVVIQLDTESSEVLKRILPQRMDQWRKKIQTRKQKRALIKAKKERDRKIAYAQRKAELFAERQQKIEQGDQPEDDEIEQTLASEFPPDEEEEETEQEDEQAAEGRIGEIIEQQMTDVKDKLEGVKRIFQEEFVSTYQIDASGKPRYVKNRIAKKLERFVTLRQNLLERVYIIKPELAQQLIDVGYLHYSRFGKWCPVSIHNGVCFPPAYGPDKIPRTVVYRKNVYYLADDEARVEFLKNPLFYLQQPTPKPIIPAKIALLGPPKSGKTSVAKRLVQEIGCVRVSLGDAVRYILEKEINTVLGKQMQTTLLAGNDIIPEIAIQCLEIALMDVKCQTRGYVLDGFPITKKHSELLSEKGIIPFKLFELQCDLTECVQRAIKDRNDPNRLYVMPDSVEAISQKYAVYQHEVGPTREWYSKEHKNWITVNGKNSKWKVWDIVMNETCNVTRKIQNYLERKAQNKAASISDLCVLPQELFNRLGEFDHYCPVSLVLRDELVDCSADTRTDYVAEYRGRYYRTAGLDELNMFLADPERFAPIEPKKLPPPPNRRPKRLTAAEVQALFPKPVEFSGYCTVTYLNGDKKYECLVMGGQDYAVQYRDKLFFMLNEQAREKFMRQPDKYWRLQLPNKLPPPKNPLDIINLPCLGYLEQTVANAIIKSLTATGSFKPKFPFLSIKSSALIYAAYHLKAYNSKSSDYLRRKFRRKLYIFEEQCELIGYLADKSTIRYKAPENRTPEYNVKYETFFALKENVPTSNWLS